MSASIVVGDCRAVMDRLPENFLDAAATDPPYHLTSIVKRFGKDGSAAAKEGADGRFTRLSGGFMGKKWDGGDIAMQPETWASLYRVLKPGAHLVAFGGTRTHHRVWCAIEDAGFEIRDTLMWVYGSGFPKSHAQCLCKVPVESGLLDRWGWKLCGTCHGQIELGTALKPAWEPILLARKPMIGTVAENVAQYGTGALNIEACRVATEESLNGGAYAKEGGRSVSPSLHAGSGMNQPGKTVGADFVQPVGRWPANLVHDGSEGVLEAFPQAAGQIARAKTDLSPQGNKVYGALRHGTKLPEPRGDKGSAARFFYCAKASRSDRDEGVEGPEKPLLWSSGQQNAGSFQSEGTKKSAKNNHPTVKPTELMRWLCRLITPPKGLIIDPFMGSGSTGKAALKEGFRFLGVEKEAPYAEIARQRIGGDVTVHHFQGAPESTAVYTNINAQGEQAA